MRCTIMKKSNLSRHILIFSLTIFSIISVLISYFIVPLCVFSKGEHTSLKIYKDKNTITLSSNQLKILQLTDTHINGSILDPFTYSVIKHSIYRTNPHLIVFTGDIFSRGASNKNVDNFLEFMDKFKLPWATVLGNHEDELSCTLNELSYKLEHSKYSLFQNGKLNNSHGNYYYNIDFLDGYKFQLIFMDSHRSGFTSDSLTYYETIVNKAYDNGVIGNFLFFHIPPSMITEVAKAYTDNPNIGYGKLKKNTNNTNK